MYIGIDPDLHCTAIALVDVAGQVMEVKAVKTKGQDGLLAVSEMIDALAIRAFPLLSSVSRGMICAIESQEIVYTSKSGANPRDLLRLGHISGACAALAQMHGIKHLLTTPSGWKGNVPKSIHHARIFAKLGWEIKLMGGKNGYGSPLSFGSRPPPGGHSYLNAGDWKHMTDAIGLALWVRELAMSPLKIKGKGFDERVGDEQCRRAIL